MSLLHINYAWISVFIYFRGGKGYGRNHSYIDFAVNTD